MLNLKEIREKSGAKAREIAEVIKTEYAGFDRPLLSKAEQPEKYGICLIPKAEALVVKAYCENALKPKKKENRTKAERVQCRLTESQYNSFIEALKHEGHATVQDGLQQIITKYIESEKEK